MNTTDNRILSELRDLKQLIQMQNLLSKPVLNLEEACEYLGVSKSYLYKLSSANKIPSYKPNGKKLFFSREELDEWLLQNRQDTDCEIETAAANYATNRPFRF